MGRHSKQKSAVIKEKIVEGTQAGKNQGEVAAELAVSREHVNRTLAELRDRFKDRSPEAFSVYVQQQVELLTKAIEEVWEGTLPPEAANSIRGLMDSIARLTGSNAPTRSENLTMTVEGDPAKLQGYRKFLHHTKHLSLADVNRLVYPYCDQLPPSVTPKELLEPSEAMK